MFGFREYQRKKQWQADRAALLKRNDALTHRMNLQSLAMFAEAPHLDVEAAAILAEAQAIAVELARLFPEIDQAVYASIVPACRRTYEICVELAHMEGS